jgi:predicted amidohydrolase
MRQIPVSVQQFPLAQDDSFAAFATRLTAATDAAASAGSRVIVFPELVTTSLLAAHPDREDFTVEDLNRIYREHFPTFTDDIVELVRDLARTRNIVVVGGSHLRRVDDGQIRNTAHIAFPDGHFVRQDKLHLTPAERAMGVEPGETVEIFDIEGMSSAVQICADIEFPEVSRILAHRGVETIFAPSLTWNTRGSERVRIGAHARAMENQVFVVVSPLVGTVGYPQDGAIHGTGNARVAVPLDRTFGRNDGVLGQTPDTRAAAQLEIILDRDLMTLSRANPEPPGFAFVRTDLYERIGTRDG